MASWGPPLRIARRTIRRSLGRTLLVAALIGVPVLAASWIGLIDKAANPTGELLGKTTIGQADARLTVTPFSKSSPLSERPSLGWGEPGPAPGIDEPDRDPTKVDPLTLLPPGSKVARPLILGNTVDVRGPETNTSVALTTGDGQNPLTAGTFKLDQGRMPAKADEVAISPSLAKYLNLLDDGKLRANAALTTAKDQKFAVVGVTRSLQDPNAGTMFATPDTPLIQPDQATSVQYLVDLPDAVDPDALTDKLVAQGALLLPRANIVDPPPSMYSNGQDAGATAVMALVIGFGILEIVLLAGTAFAVGARRQTRELGLVTATGGTPRDVRRIVLVQGLFAGIIGAGSGVVLALVAVFAARPLWERMLSMVFVGWQIPWPNLIAVAVLGAMAGLAAAIVPAISAGRQTPMAALAGRFAVVAGSGRLRKPAVILLAAGVASTLLGNVWMAAALETARKNAGNVDYQVTITPTGPIAMVLVGITASIIALVWMLPNLVAKTAGLARILPLSGRLALRDAARHRHRTGPATAAVMMAVAATAAVAFAASNAIAAEAKNYIPTARHGDAVLRFEQGSDGSMVFSQPLAEKVAGMLPAKARYDLGSVSLPDAKANGGYLPTLMAIGPPGMEGTVGYPLLVVDPEYLARFDDYGRQAAEALRAGKIVVQRTEMLTSGSVKVTSDDDYEGKKSFGHAAVAITSPPKISALQQSSLISPDAARKLGTVLLYETQFELKREPTDSELAAVAKVLGHDDLLTIEKGYQSPARLWFLGLIGAATVVTLLGVAISVSLSAAEGRADLATLAAVGAPPRRRRNLAAAQAWVLGQLGCVLGVGIGALYGYTAHAAFGSPRFMVPWQEIGGIVIVVPLFAGLLAWLLTRSRLPMVRRVD